MNGPRSLARHAWRRITLRLFASYMVVGLAAVTVLGAAGGFFAVHYFDTHGRQSSGADFEISLLAAAWIVPLLSRSIAGLTTIPLGLIVMLTFYVFVLRRAVQDRADVAVGARGIAQA